MEAVSLSSVTQKWQSVWATLVGDDVVVSFVQSDLDAVGAYGGGVRVDILEGHTGLIFNPSQPEDLLFE